MNKVSILRKSGPCGEGRIEGGSGSTRYVCSSLEVARALTVLPQTFQRRLHIATMDPLLQKHVHVLQRLGVDGMSSDESDVEELWHDPAVRRRQPSYFVSTPAWRHPSLTAWLLAFDSMHVISRRMAGNRLRGAYPRCRIYARDRSSKSKRYVSHLPKTAYNPDWLKTRNNIEFTVAPTEEIYPFTHDDHVDMYVISCSRLDHSSNIMDHLGCYILLFTIGAFSKMHFGCFMLL